MLTDILAAYTLHMYVSMRATWRLTSYACAKAVRRMMMYFHTVEAQILASVLCVWLEKVR